MLVAKPLPWHFITYNALSTRAVGRWDDLTDECKDVHCVGLQGTRDKHDLDVHARLLKHHFCFSWAPAKGAAHRCGGVALMLAKSRFKLSQVRKVWSFPNMQGRLGAIRIKGKLFDFTFIVAYFPVDDGKKVKRNQYIKLCSEVKKLLEQLPCRTIPILLTDANAHTGCRLVDGAWTKEYSNSLGQHAKAKENFNGKAFTDLLESQGMVAANTFFDSEPTFYSGDGLHSSTVDYICIPEDLLGHTSDCSTNSLLGTKVQLVKSNLRVDHFPVSLKLKYRRWFSNGFGGFGGSGSGGIPKPVSFDGNNVTGGVRGGFQGLGVNYVAGLSCACGGEGNCCSGTTGDSGGIHKPLASYAKWDRNKLVVALECGGKLREDLVHNVCNALNKDKVYDLARHLDRPEPLWEYITECIFLASSSFLAKPGQSNAWIRSDDYQQLLDNRKDLRLLAVDLDDKDYAASLLRSVDRKIRNVRRRDLKKAKALLAEALSNAWLSRDFFNAYRIAYLLSHGRHGPKKRRYDKPPSCKFTLKEWTDFCALPASNGGFSASVVDGAIPTANPITLCRNEALLDQSIKDYRSMSFAIRKMGTRKVSPGIPIEIWRMLFWPNRAPKKKNRPGLGGSAPELDNHSFRNALIELLYNIRCNQCAPLHWHVGKAGILDKPGKTVISPAQQRILGIFDALGKVFFKVLWRRRTNASELPSFSYAYQSGKSREMAIMQHECLAWRLRRCDKLHARVHHDLRNAFFAPHLHCLQDTINAQCTGRDAALLLDRVQNSALCFTDGEEHTVLKLGSGFAPGDAWVAELFNEVMSPCLQDWSESAPELEIDGQLQWVDVDGDLCSGTFDCSRACYADDLSRIIMGEGFGHLCLNVAVSDSALNVALRPKGFSQNKDKQVALPYICGTGSHLRYHTLHAVGRMANASVEASTKWLGYLAHFAGVHNAEIDARISAAKRNCAKLKGFWHHGPRRFASTVFQSAVCSAAWAGLDALIVGKTTEKKIDQTLCALARPLFKGAACKKILTLAGTKFEALSNTHVWHKIRAAPASVELQIARLRLWQRILRHRDQCLSLWTALVGSFEWDPHAQFEADGKLVTVACQTCQKNRTDAITAPCKHSANPWLRHFFYDLVALRDHDDLAHVADLASNNFKEFLLDCRVHKEFLELKLDVLRSPYLTKSVPPPGYKACTETPCDPDKPFVCGLRLDDGTPCGEAFATKLGLVMHQVRSKNKGNNHGARALSRITIIDNQCPVCLHVFSTKYGAQCHLTRSVQNGQCFGLGNPTAKLCVAKQTNCPICEVDYLHPSRLKVHFRLWHLQGILSNKVSDICLESSSDNE